MIRCRLVFWLPNKNRPKYQSIHFEFIRFNGDHKRDTWSNVITAIEIVILGATMVDIKDCLADSSSCRQPIELDHFVVANRFTIISDTGHWTAADPFDPFWSSLDNDVDPFVSIENYCHHRGDGRADSHASCPSEFSCVRRRKQSTLEVRSASDRMDVPATTRHGFQ